jgi:hypothetical protein
MEIHVYDTYVKAGDGHTMHFDVITNEKDHDKAIQYAQSLQKNVNSVTHRVHQNLLHKQ